MTVLEQINKWTWRTDDAYASSMPAEEPDEEAMATRAIRVPTKLWERYGAACKGMGTTRSDEVRRHMVAVADAYEHEQRRKARESGEAAQS